MIASRLGKNSRVYSWVTAGRYCLHVSCRCVNFSDCPGVRERFAGVAQLVEHLICNQRVRGSNPFASSKLRRLG